MATLDDVVQGLRSVESSVEALWVLVIPLGIILFVLGVLKLEDTNSITVYYALSEKSGGRLEAEGPLVFTAIPERQEVLVENMGDGLGPESLVENWRKHCAVRNPRNWLCLPSGQSPDIFHMREGRPDYRTLTVILAADQLGRWVWRLTWLDWWLVKHGMRPPWVRFDP